MLCCHVWSRTASPMTRPLVGVPTATTVVVFVPDSLHRNQYTHIRIETIARLVGSASVRMRKKHRRAGGSVRLLLSALKIYAENTLFRVNETCTKERYGSMLGAQSMRYADKTAVIGYTLLLIHNAS
uniref:Secreted protein n=1 Tax=Panagrellus redivivus TaxID=6233 RepID=A0A7E4V1J7_PANRE